MGATDEKELTKLVHEISMAHFGKPFNDKAIYNNRLRTTGGRYLPGKRTIELNPKYTTEFDDEEVIGIIKHELCHYHLHIEGKGFKHGDKDFKALLKATGSPRHCSPLPSMKDRYKHIYKCKNCGHSYKRLRRIDLNKYRCGKCRGKLVKVTLENTSD